MSRRVKVLISCWLGDLNDIGVSGFVKAVRSLGVDGIELSLDYPLTLNSPKSRELMRLLLSHNLSLAIHLPWREVHLASPIEDVRLASLKVARRSLGTYDAMLNVEYILTHLSTKQAFCGRDDEECVKAAVKSLTALAMLADDLGTQVLVETISDRCCSNEDRLPSIMEGIKLSNVGVCVDLPHILERRHRLWGESITALKGVLRDIPPVILEKAVGAHVHGVKRLRGQVVSHVMPSRRFLSLLMKEYVGNLKRLEYVTIEIFRDRFGREVKDLSTLRWVVDRVRRFLSNG